MPPHLVRPASRYGWVPCLPSLKSTTIRASSFLCPTLPTRPHHRVSLLRQPNQSLPSPSLKASATPPSSNNPSISPPVPPQPSPPPTTVLERLLNTLTSLFPLWVFLGAVAAFAHPPTFLWFATAWIGPVLCTIMLGMGLTLSFSDFAVVLKRPWVVLLGVSSQYIIMPASGLLLGSVLNLPPQLAAGLLLVSCCPGGAASNIVCLIGGADVALSVVLTLCSTLTSVIAIPTLMKLLGGSIVDIRAAPLLISTAQVVLLPLFLGLVLQRLFPALVARAAKSLPAFSVAGVVLICGSVVARTSLASLSPPLVAAVFLLHAFGGTFGYCAAMLFRLPTSACRTISIEVCMQNSALAVALATLHFSSPLVSIPGAISATMHSILGSVLAGFWRFRDERKKTLAGGAD